ncbi:unnamed protein product [Schistosoma curassoni]|uniref:Transposase n=1 Tax=Schistosoma curassoni TaxID=6186 RepID=A0A183KYP0_9TREM|nr:unnamed protein product [Schistosoma curassoni]
MGDVRSRRGADIASDHHLVVANLKMKLKKNPTIYRLKHWSDIGLTANMLHLLFKNSWEEEQVPMEWKEGHLIKIPKQ